MSTFRQQFLNDNQLPSNYLLLAEQWIEPLGDTLSQQFLTLREQDSQRAMIVGISGCQGSGKSTMAGYLQLYLQEHHALNCAACSIDDFYLSLSNRQYLAEHVHPLLKTRGVPGTHDIDNLIHCLQLAKIRQPFELPVFDKLRDDIAPEKQFINAGIDVFILEGWCLGASAQSDSELQQPINTLERTEDVSGEYRHYVNQQLKDHYALLSDCFDSLIQLKAPSFEVVKGWRFEQERKLLQKHLDNTAQTEDLSDQPEAMNGSDIERFIQFFQRITEQLIRDLPDQADHVLVLDEQRKIIAYTQAMLES